MLSQLGMVLLAILIVMVIFTVPAIILVLFKYAHTKQKRTLSIIVIVCLLLPILLYGLYDIHKCVALRIKGESLQEVLLEQKPMRIDEFLEQNKQMLGISSYRIRGDEKSIMIRFVSRKSLSGLLMRRREFYFEYLPGQGSRNEFWSIEP